MFKPKCVRPGDTVGVIAPSDAVEKGEFLDNLKILEDWGLKVKLGRHIYSKVGDFAAGTAEERAEDLQTMIDDPEVRVIWAANGGYAASEILSVFNRETVQKLRQDPKWFVGYSDICLMLNRLSSFRIVNIMGPTVWGLSEWDTRSQEELRKLLFGEMATGIGPDYAWKGEIAGQAQGRILVSDLEPLLLSFGTRGDPLMYGRGPIILGIEELDIEKSTLQRQIDVILSHRRSARISGMIVGRLVNIREMSYPEWGKDFSAQQLIADRFKKFGKGKLPLAFLDDFGHAEWEYEEVSEAEKLKANHTFLPFPNGVSARLSVSETECKLEYLENVCII